MKGRDLLSITLVVEQANIGGAARVEEFGRLQVIKTRQIGLRTQSCSK
jgi:hypothetical protein